MEKHLFRLLFSTLLGFLGLIIYLWFTTPSLHATGAVHPTFESMLKSGYAESNNSSATLFSYFFALFTVFSLCLVLMIGMKKKGQLGFLKKWLVIGTILYLLVFSGLTWSYWNYSPADPASYFGGFPLPTAWMIYGVPLFALFFTFLYLKNFDNWVLTQNDSDRFKAIVSKNSPQNKVE